MDVSSLIIPTTYGNSRLQLVHLKESRRCKCHANRPNILRLGVDIPIQLKSVNINESREILLISPCVDTVEFLMNRPHTSPPSPPLTPPF